MESCKKIIPLSEKFDNNQNISDKCDTLRSKAELQLFLIFPKPNATSDREFGDIFEDSNSSKVWELESPPSVAQEMEVTTTEKSSVSLVHVEENKSEMIYDTDFLKTLEDIQVVISPNKSDLTDDDNNLNSTQQKMDYVRDTLPVITGNYLLKNADIPTTTGKFYSFYFFQFRFTSVP